MQFIKAGIATNILTNLPMHLLVESKDLLTRCQRTKY